MQLGDKILKIIVFLCIGIIHGADSDKPKIVYSTRATQQDVDSLAEINRNEILPFLLFDQINNNKDYQLPLGLSIASIKDGRFTSDSLFYTIPPRKETFFCPKNALDRCLVAEEFDDSKPLQCADEIIPVIEEDPRDKKCGQFGSGIRYNFQYKFCQELRDQGFELQYALIYQFCYGKEEKINLFTLHTIASPLLLSEKLLTREQQVEFNIVRNEYGFEDSDFGSGGIIDAETSEYKLQQLVPAADMALASWRRPTYHFLNYRLQHYLLKELWDDINGYIRKHAIELHAFKIFLHTGVFNVKIDKEYSSKNFWAKLVIDRNSAPFKGLAILMNNFISDEPMKNRVDSTDPTETYIDQFCQKSLCLASLTEKFDRVGGRIRCCEATPEILQLFDLGITIPRVLSIYDINFQ